MLEFIFDMAAPTAVVLPFFALVALLLGWRDLALELVVAGAGRAAAVRGGRGREVM